MGKNLQLENFFILFFIKTYNLPIHKKASIKNVQAPDEAFSPQKRTSSTAIHENSNFFLFLWAILALLDPNPDSESG
jgi:hypothetical protein